MQKVFEKIIGQLESKAFERYGKKGMGGQMVIDCDDAIEIVKQTAEEFATDNNVGDNGWIPCSEPPETGVYVLLSFSNFSVPIVGRYEEDEKGGAYYIGDEDETCTQKDMFVNAWQQLPAPYNLHICTDNDCTFNEENDCLAAEGCGDMSEKELTLTCAAKALKLWHRSST